MSYQILVNQTYSLPPDYVPDDLCLTKVPFPEKEFLEKKLLRKTAAFALEQLFTYADSLGYSFFAISGYRSYKRQQEIYASHVKKYGLEYSSQVSAKPGCSEHQTGLAMDICSLYESFENTKEFKWLNENAADYGFILRYPEDKQDITKIIYEPWHWRYVGVDAAREMKASGQCLEEYLGVE